MLKNTLARFSLVVSLLAGAGCADRGAPQIISVPVKELDRPGNLSVTGTAVLEISPDYADLTMTMIATETRPGLAATALQKRQQELVDALKKVGVDGPNLKLSYLRLDPVYSDTT